MNIRRFASAQRDFLRASGLLLTAVIALAITALTLIWMVTP